MDDQRLAGKFLCGYSGKIGKPVMGVDHIEFILMLHGYGATHHGIAGDLFHQVGSIASGETEFLADMLGERLLLESPLRLYHLLELVRIDIRDHIRSDSDELDLVQELVNGRTYGLHRYIAGIDDPGSALVFVSGSRRHHEYRLDSVIGQTLHDTIASRTETAGDMRREFPSEHQHSHDYASLYFDIR